MASEETLFPAWCAEAWVAYQAYRNLGFTPDEIFFGGGIQVIGVGRAIVMQVKRSEMEFIWTIAKAPEDEADEALDRRWLAFTEHMNLHASDAERKAVWDCSDMVHQGGPPYLALARGLIAKGFKLEAFDERATAALKALGPL